MWKNRGKKDQPLFGSFFQPRNAPRFLKDEIPGLVEQGYEGDVPSMKVRKISNEAKKNSGQEPRGRDHFGRENNPQLGDGHDHLWLSRWWFHSKICGMFHLENWGR